MQQYTSIIMTQALPTIMHIKKKGVSGS